MGARRGSRRSDEQLVLGVHPVEEYLAYLPELVREVLADPSRRSRLEEIQRLAQEKGVTFRWVNRAVLDRVARGEGHRGILARVRGYPYAEFEDLLARGTERDGLLVALDEVQDPQNVGSVIRSAAFFGAAGVLLMERRACGVTPSVVKASSGAVVHVDVALVKNMARALEEARQRGALVLGADAHEGVPAHALELEGEKPVVLVVGSEHKGLRRLVREKCDALVTIEGRGGAESLNVGVAAGILIYRLTLARLT